MRSASISIQMRDHCLETVRKHKCNSANPDAEDFEEVVKSAEEFFSNDDVIKLMVTLIDEKKKLTEAIGIAKASIRFDIDAATATNKFRQELNNTIRVMMQFKPSNRIETAIGHKFNVEGNQVDYKYDVEVTSTEAYNKEEAKKIMKAIISESDKTSADIDVAKINTTVEYTPLFDVNDTFEDVMKAFLEDIK